MKPLAPPHRRNPAVLLILLLLLPAPFFLYASFPIPPTLSNLYAQPLTYPSPNLFTSWQAARETCPQWISSQTISRSYVDAYIIGSQKGATSELSRRMGDVGLKKPGLVKEWLFFNYLTPEGNLSTSGMYTHQPVKNHNLAHLRHMHFSSGFPDANRSTPELIDTSPPETRLLSIDATVEYLHSDRSAFLAHMLTPHAKIIVTIREPAERALSQYNLFTRLYNEAKRSKGVKDEPAHPAHFHAIVKREIENLKKCGYDHRSGLLKQGMTTSQLVACMLNGQANVKFEDLLYVTRGLYHLHIDAWRTYFPDHRIMYISFNDFLSGKRSVYNDLSQFLCVRPFPERMLKEYERNGRNESFGVEAAKTGVKKAGFDKYGGNDRYMSEMNPQTRQMLDEFYAGGRRRLVHMMGRHMY